MAISKKRMLALKKILESRKEEVGIVVNNDGELDDDEKMIVELMKETNQKVEDSLSKLERDEYGYCSACNDEIEEERLRALPFAVRCKECEYTYEVHRNKEREKQKLGLAQSGRLLLF